MDKRAAMKRIMELSFTMADTSLYLDTHPNDRQALAHYRKHRPMLMAAMEQYEREFGPLTLMSAADKDTWAWGQQPWPWEKEG